MSTLGRLAAFAGVLVAVFAAAVAAGRAVGPTDRSSKDAAEPVHGPAEPEAAHEGAAPQGLAVAAGGLRLVPQTTTFAAGRTSQFRFRILDAEGATVRDFDVEHEKELHLIVVRRDISRYVHVHPVQQRDGSWSVPLRFADAGTYRVFADFTVSGGERTTLGTDVFVPGPVAPRPLPPAAPVARVGGYEVVLSGAGGAGDERELAFSVSRGGRPVAVERYLGADGHLVTLREGDLAYLHAHPLGGSPAAIRFMVEYPSAGRYRLFLQFKHAGKVRTAAFTQEVS